MKKYFHLIFFLALPFLVTATERLLIRPLVSIFPLPDTSIFLMMITTITLLMLAYLAFRGENYGLQFDKKLRKILTGLFLVLIASCYLFLFSLNKKGFFDSFAIVHLLNLVIAVFREEFLLRGIIQTEADSILKEKFLKISQAIWLTTITFSIWHLVNLQYWPWQVVAIQMLACFPSGIIFGLIKQKTGNTLLTYLLHICGDLLGLAFYTLLTGKLFFSLF